MWIKVYSLDTMKTVDIPLHTLSKSITCARISMNLYESRDLFDNLIHELRVTLAGEVQKPIVIESPEDWWQHFKQRFFKWKWLQRKYPVKLKRTTVDVKMLYVAILFCFLFLFVGRLSFTTVCQRSKQLFCILEDKFNVTKQRLSYFT